jgi:hypothetical protein
MRHNQLVSVGHGGTVNEGTPIQQIRTAGHRVDRRNTSTRAGIGRRHYLEINNDGHLELNLATTDPRCRKVSHVDTSARGVRPTAALSDKVAHFVLRGLG